MKFPKEDFPLIRTALILLAAAIVFSIGGIAGSIYLKDLMQKNKIADQKQLADIRTKLSQVREEEQKIRLYLAKYQRLGEKGLLDREDRLTWIENITRIKENRKLFGIDYQIDPQQAVQTDPALPRGGLTLHGSIVKLEFLLLHEGDLFLTLNDLREKNKGFSLLRDCTLTRMGKNTGFSVAPRLHAECTLAWLSLKSQTETTGQ